MEDSQSKACMIEQSIEPICRDFDETCFLMSDEQHKRCASHGEIISHAGELFMFEPKQGFCPFVGY